jgi:hypothetical protein
MAASSTVFPFNGRSEDEMLIVPARLRDIQSIDAGSAEVQAGFEWRNASTATRRAELATETA